VQYLLRHYQIAAPDLLTVVRQIQWPDIRAGASLADMQQMLESHGVQTRPVQIPADHVLVGPHASIVHLRGVSPSAIGHYVVLLPGTTRTWARVWDREEVREMPTWELATRSSGTALVTAPPEAVLSDIKVVMTADAVILRCGCLSLGMLTLGTIGFMIVVRRK
jgi:ABC-type bacteriocin/lantibiotic exporter with double-glycine peptidase domain